MSEAKFNKVMVIDDNTIDLYVTARIMSKTHFCNDLLQYSSALDALKYFRENTKNEAAWPDVILVDIYMPEMSGFEFMEAFGHFPEALKKYPKIFIVSSSIDAHDIERAANNPYVMAFQEKPLSPEFLESIE